MTTFYKFITLFIVLSMSLIILITEIIDGPNGHSKNFIEILLRTDDNLPFLLIGYFSPIFFIIESLIIKYPFKKGTKTLFFFQSFGFLIISLLLIFILGMNKNNMVSSYYNSLLIFLVIHIGIMFTCGIWSLFLSSPLSKYRIINWPFDKRKGYEP